jgi:hypothetical protein
MNKFSRFAHSCITLALPLLLAACGPKKAARPEIDPGTNSLIRFESAGERIALRKSSVEGNSQKGEEADFIVPPAQHRIAAEYSLDVMECADSSCRTEHPRGTCIGNFESASGKSYLVELINTGGSARATIYAGKERFVVGSGECHEDR